MISAMPSCLRSTCLDMLYACMSEHAYVRMHMFLTMSRSSFRDGITALGFLVIIICFTLAFLTQGGLWDLAPCATMQSWSYTTGMTHSLRPCMFAAYTCANKETAAAVVLLLPSHSVRTAAVEDILLPTALYIGLFIVILTRPI